MTITRTLVVWMPHWPLTAARVPPSVPAVVVHANRVVAASPAARDDQVIVGLRRREAQARSPEVVVIEHDADVDARCFEPVVAALEPITPRIEIIEPGWCSFPTRGPARYFGGDHSLADRVIESVDAAIADRTLNGASGEDIAQVGARIGVADGPFAAELAARATRAGDRTARTYVVEPEASPAFLADLPVTTLDHRHRRLRDGEPLVDLLWRLGLTTLGDVACLPHRDLVARFGPDGHAIHRLASGLDEQPPDTRPPPPQWAVQAELDPPIQRIDTAAFWAKSLADELHDRLAAEGVTATRVLVEAETEHGETLARSWRHEGTLGVADMAARVRWQLDGWLHSAARPTAGIQLLRLVPEEVVAAVGRQMGFWGEESQATERASRALARVQAMVGVDGVTVPELRGGRGPADRVALMPVAATGLTDRPIETPDSAEAPWPGRLPSPSPALVSSRPVPIEVLGAAGRPVEVGARGVLSEPPVRVGAPGTPTREVTGWAGPWLCDERWWDPATHQRQARIQVVLDDGTAHLLTRRAGAWYLEASYD
jgi:protein ImuB